MNIAQRIVVLLALGVVLHVSSQVILFESPQVFVGTSARFGGLGQLLVVTVHVGTWLGAALWLLRDRD